MYILYLRYLHIKEWVEILALLYKNNTPEYIYHLVLLKTDKHRRRARTTRGGRWGDAHTHYVHLRKTIQCELSKCRALAAIEKLNEAALVYGFPTRMETLGTLPRIVHRKLSIWYNVFIICLSDNDYFRMEKTVVGKPACRTMEQRKSTLAYLVL